MKEYKVVRYDPYFCEDYKILNELAQGWEIVHSTVIDSRQILFFLCKFSEPFKKPRKNKND